MRLNKNTKVIAIVAACVVGILIYISSRMTTTSGTNIVSLAIKEAGTPFIFVWENTASFFENAWDKYHHLSNAADENAVLRKDNEILKAKLLASEENFQEVNRLRTLLGFRERLQDPHVVAEVSVGRKNSPFKTVLISAGRAQGVEVGMPVVAADGVVGKVLRAGLKYSEVQLLVDSDFNVDVLIQRTRVRGVLSGTSQSECRLNMQKVTEIRMGDVIVTSGIVGAFPKGMPLGKVVRISYETDRVSQIITVEPFVDWRRVEEVVVLKRKDEDLEKIIETASRDWLENSVESKSGG